MNPDEELELCEGAHKRVRFESGAQCGCRGVPLGVAGAGLAEPSSGHHDRHRSSDQVRWEYLRQLYFQWHLSIVNYRWNCTFC